MKKWYKSKTIQTNIALSLIILIQLLVNKQIIDMDIQATIVAILNVWLRFKTDTKIIK